MATWRISDTVTYARSWHVEAETEDEARTKANSEGPSEDAYEEDQIDNTPYEVELLED
jgi:hypothetical protein